MNPPNHNNINWWKPTFLGLFSWLELQNCLFGLVLFLFARHFPYELYRLLCTLSHIFHKHYTKSDKNRKLFVPEDPFDDSLFLFLVRLIRLRCPCFLQFCAFLQLFEAFALNRGPFINDVISKSTVFILFLSLLPVFITHKFYSIKLIKFIVTEK